MRAGGVTVSVGVVLGGVVPGGIVGLAVTVPVELTLKLKVLLGEAFIGPPDDTLMRHFPSEAVAVTA